MKQCPICDTNYTDEQTTCSTDGAALLEIREWPPGTMVRGKYRILAKAGQGGMGAVYKATHVVFEELWALKVMASQLAADPKFVRRFRQEAQAARKLQHQNIVRVQDFDQAEDGSPFIVMEYVDGVSLQQLMKAARGPLPLARALWIARGIAEGLGAAHVLGMIHRDVKPENVLLARDAQGRDVPKILDFGIVAMKEGSTSLSTGLLLTPAYGSPEQWRGMRASELDGRSDLYALGVALYEMVTGRSPFQVQNDAGWMHAHLEESPPPPSQLNPELAEAAGVDALVLRLIEKDRERRPKDAQALVSELNLLEAQLSWQRPTVVVKQLSANMPTRIVARPPVAAEESATASPAAAKAPLAAVPPEVAPERKPATAARELEKRSSTRVIGAVIVAAVLALSIGWWLAFRTPASPAALVEQALKYEKGDGVAKNGVKAAELNRRAADLGDAAGQYNLGRMYRDGVGVEKDPVQAAQWFLRAAQQNNADAENEIGMMYQRGVGEPRDEGAAAAWYRKAAGQGNAVAQYNLGWMYEHGRGVPQDVTEALAWYHKSADQGNAVAEYTLGSLFDQGQGVSKSDSEAAGWYRKAADHDYPAAQNSLALMYLDGRGVPQDEAQAVQLFHRSAERGYPFGQHNLAEMYAQGRTTPKDPVEAYKWLLLAKEGGDQSAQARLTELERDMTSAQVAEATRRVEVWKVQHPSTRA